MVPSLAPNFLLIIIIISVVYYTLHIIKSFEDGSNISFIIVTIIIGLLEQNCILT